MKFAILTFFLLLSCTAQACAQTGEASEVKRFREMRDKSFRNPGETPLASAEFLNFKGLEYFEVSEKYIVKARLEKTADRQVFMMPTSTGTTRKYFKYGVLTFALDGRSFSLNAYQSEAATKNNKTNLFVPFRDLTNGTETYGAGRYLDVKVPSGEEVILDFNFAFNPNCAYGNESFICAIPPRENFLQTEIKAGEKIFPSAAQKQ
jgi:uncharacterized protein